MSREESWCRASSIDLPGANQPADREPPPLSQGTWSTSSAPFFPLVIDDEQGVVPPTLPSGLSRAGTFFEDANSFSLDSRDAAVHKLAGQSYKAGCRVK